MNGFWKVLFDNWKVVMSLTAIVAFAYAGIIDTRIRLANLESAKDSRVAQWKLIRMHGEKLQVHEVEIKHLNEARERHENAIEALRRRN